MTLQTKLPGSLIQSGSIPVTAITDFASEISSVLPTGVVSSSAQYPGWVTASSQIDYNSITNKLSGVVSSSTQVQPLLPDGTVSASNQVDYNNIQNKLSGVVSSSTQVQPLLPDGTVSSSGQVDYNSITNKLADVVSSSAQIQPLLPDGTVSSSGQVDYNSITNKLSGVVSSSTQIVPLLPTGTISASSQVELSGITGTTFAAANFNFPQNLTVAGTLTAQTFNSQLVSASIIYESGSSKFGDTDDDIMSVTGSILVLGGRISGSMVGMFSSSAQVDYNSIQNKLSGVVSSSTQVQPLLPAGTVSSSGQVDYNSITNKLSGVVSSSAQVKPLLPAGTVSSSGQVDYNLITNKLSGVYSSSAFATVNQGTLRLTLNGVALTDVDTGLQADDRPLFSGSQFSGIVSGSGTQYRLVVPVGTNFYAT